MRLTRCKGSGCEAQLTDHELQQTRCFYPAFWGLCDNCRAKVGDAIDRAGKKYGDKLRREGKHTGQEIQGMEDRFKRKLMKND